MYTETPANYPKGGRGGGGGLGNDHPAWTELIALSEQPPPQAE